MHISTWNLEGRWTPQHRDVLLQQGCDLWLLTEVAAGTRLPGYAAVTTEADMLPGKAWAAVLSRRALTRAGTSTTRSRGRRSPAARVGRRGSSTSCGSATRWHARSGARTACRT
jgi:hypothetical protein